MIYQMGQIKLIYISNNPILHSLSRLLVVHSVVVAKQIRNIVYSVISHRYNI